VNGTVHGAVSDEGDMMPTVRARPSITDENGRGLAIVESLADRWGCSLPSVGNGKTVWFLIALEETDSA
jgi:hypothetical protein